MQKERYPSEATHFPKKVKAKVILAKCPYAGLQADNLFGIRIQKFGSDWKRTWAFKIDEERALHEGYDKERIHGTFYETDEYPGCPYCGVLEFAQCGGCKKIFCSKYEERSICPWCGERLRIRLVDSFDLKGGGY